KRETVENILWKIPVCASILESLGMFRFTSALEMFLASGKMQDDAVLDSIAMTDCKPVEEKLKKCSRRMEEGIGFAQAAYDEELFEPIYGRMLLPGERSGNMESVLQRLTGLLKDNCMNLTEHLVNIIEPLLSGVLMVTIGLTLLSVMLPLIGMMNSIG
ncbi:MAG: type II secretion system F family protein, partial [Solobacterium sp.]|nr:type II secretion system F family protein [Solobacterium sp.]